MCRNEFCECGQDPRRTHRVNLGVKIREGPKNNGGVGVVGKAGWRRHKRRSRSVCKAAWGWGADGSELFLFLVLCLPSSHRLCPAALCRGTESKAPIQKQWRGYGLTVDARRDTWPAPQRSRKSLVLGTPTQTSDFPFLAGAS